MIKVRSLHPEIFQLFTTFFTRKLTSDSLSFEFFKITTAGFAAYFYLEDTPRLTVKLDLIPALKLDSSKLFVFKGKDHLQRSFVLNEMECFTLLPSSAKTGYIFAKSICSVLGAIIDKPVLSDVVDKTLSSHLLKRALFNAAAREEGSNEVLRPYEWAQRIFEEMMDTEMCNVFSGELMLDEYLFDNDIVYPKQMYLNYFVKRFIGLESLPNETKLREYRALFLETLMKVLQS